MPQQKNNKLHTLSNNFLTIRVSPLGGSIVDAYDAKGRSIFRPYKGDLNGFNGLDAACFPLVPMCGRVANSQFRLGGKHYQLAVNSKEDFQYIHGDVWLAEWSVIEHSELHILLCYRHQSSGSPYQYKVEQHISLDDNQLLMSLFVTHLGEEPLPYGLGFHPFFPRTKEMVLKFEAKNWWVSNKNKIPDKKESIPSTYNFSQQNKLPERLIDHCYGEWNSYATIEYPKRKLKIELTADNFFRNLMLYAPTDPSDFFCLEPMTHIPNGINQEDLGGMQLIDSGESIYAHIKLTVN